MKSFSGLSCSNDCKKFEEGLSDTFYIVLYWGLLFIFIFILRLWVLVRQVTEVDSISVISGPTGECPSSSDCAHMVEAGPFRFLTGKFLSLCVHIVCGLLRKSPA